MPYRIKDDDDGVQDAMRRIADEQIGRALSEIADDDLSFEKTVHQVRKRCKKLRGLVRLVRPAFEDYSDENKTFRDAARLLSDIRDAHTLIETCDAITEHFADQTDRRSFAQIRARLVEDATAIRQEADAAVRMETFRRMMAEAKERAANWELEKEAFDAIAGGLGKTYKRARKRMEDAWSDPTVDALHEWRKRVKYHWYHSRLLSEINPSMMDPHIDAADDLSDLLGDHHDLAVLDDRLMEAPEDFGSKTDLEAFRALLHARKNTLEKRAFGLARVLLSERKKALVKRWEGYWSCWQDGNLEQEMLLVKA